MAALIPPDAQKTAQNRKRGIRSVSQTDVNVIAPVVLKGCRCTGLDGLAGLLDEVERHLHTVEAPAETVAATV